MSEYQDELAPAAQGSPLAGLRARRQKITEGLTLDLVVPRWDEDGGDPVYVRFRPLDSTEIATAQKRVSKSKDPAVIVGVNAGLLALACQGVFTVVDGEEVSIDPADPHGEWPKIDEQLGELLGVDHPTRVVDVARGLYFTDGDLLGHAGRLSEWSGFKAADVDREYEGN